MMKKLLLMVIALIALTTVAFAGNEHITPPKVTPGGLAIMIEGQVTDVNNTPVEGAQVEVYCMDKKGKDTHHIASLETDESGEYSTLSVSFINPSKCNEGYTAWVKVYYNDQTFESEHVPVVKDRETRYATIDVFVGVPEFSTITLIFATLSATLGLVFLRRD